MRTSTRTATAAAAVKATVYETNSREIRNWEGESETDLKLSISETLTDYLHSDNKRQIVEKGTCSYKNRGKEEKNERKRSECILWSRLGQTIDERSAGWTVHSRKNETRGAKIVAIAATYANENRDNSWTIKLCMFNQICEIPTRTWYWFGKKCFGSCSSTTLKFVCCRHCYHWTLLCCTVTESVTEAKSEQDTKKSHFELLHSLTQHNRKKTNSLNTKKKRGEESHSYKTKK